MKDCLSGEVFKTFISHDEFQFPGLDVFFCGILMKEFCQYHRS